MFNVCDSCCEWSHAVAAIALTTPKKILSSEMDFHSDYCVLVSKLVSWSDVIMFPISAATKLVRLVRVERPSGPIGLQLSVEHERHMLGTKGLGPINLLKGRQSSSLVTGEQSKSFETDEGKLQ